MSASCPPHKSAVEEMHTIPICLPGCLPAVPPLSRARRGVMGVLALMAPGGGAVQCISNRSDPPPPPPPSLRSVRSCRKDDIGAHFMHASFCPFRALFFHPPHFHPTRCTSALSPFHSGSSGCDDNPGRQIPTHLFKSHVYHSKKRILFS